MRIFTRSGRLGYDFYYGPVGPNRKRVRKLTQFTKGQEEQVIIEAANALSQYVTKAEEEAGEIRPTFTWGEAVVQYIREKSNDDKSSLSMDIAKFRWMEKNIPGVAEIPLKKITRRWVTKNIREPLRDKGLKKRTINHYLEVVGHLLNLAATEWETETGYTWLEHAPKIKLEKLSKREKTRVRWLTKQDTERLLNELPDHLKPIYRFALNTGLRTKNLQDLEWEQVDLVRKLAWIHPDEAKAGKAIGVPLNDEAVEIVRGQIGNHQKYVFTNNWNRHYKNDFNTKAWYKALDRAALRIYTRKDDPRYPTHHPSEYKFTDLHWHDATRHTWATWHVMGGTRLEILQELGAWSDFKMVKKYAHFNTEHIAEFAGNAISGATASDNILQNRVSK